MKFFEKNIKDRFKNAASLEGVDADDLWKNIASSIGTESPKRKFIFFRKGYLLILLSLFLVGGAVVWNQITKESNSNIEMNHSDSITEFQNIENKNIENKKVNQIKNEEASEGKENENPSFVQSEILENSPAVILSKNENKTQSFPLKTKQEPINSIEKNNNLLRNDNQNIIPLKDELFKNEIKKASTPIQKDVLKSEQLFNGQKIDFTKIASFDLLLSAEQEDELALNELIILSNFKDKKSKISLGIFTGIHTIKNKFSSKLTADQERKDLLNQGFQYELGHSFALEASFHFNKNIFITSGLEYLKSKSEFNFSQTWDTIIVNPNSPVGILTDAFATRTVKHHNKMEYFSLPILLGLKKSFGKIELGMSSGIGLNFSKTQIGRSLNFSNQVTYYPSDENDFLPVSKFFISYHLRPHLNYVLNEKISIQLRTDIRYQNFGESDFYQLKYASFFYGLSGGVQFMF